MAEQTHDVVIIGGGPAGLTAALHAGRARLDTLMLESALPGGEMALSNMVEAYPGFPDGISGFELGEMMRRHAESFGARLASAHADRLFREGELWVVECEDGSHRGRAAIVATGERHRKLRIPGEAEFEGRGVSHHAARDGSRFRDKPVAIVGGGNAAATAAEFLTRFCSRVLLVLEDEHLNAERILQERLQTDEKIEIRAATAVTRISGEDEVASITLRAAGSDNETSEAVAGVFVLIGWEPNSELLQGIAKLDTQGYAQAGEDTVTTAPGLFVAGDVRGKPLRRPTTAVSDGAVAAHMAGLYVQQNSRSGGEQ